MPSGRILLYFTGSRLLFLFFALLASLVMPLREGYLGGQVSPPATPYLAWIWANFDGRHFIQIATQGYQKFNFAFFPLYPMLVSAIGYIMPHVWAGIFISLVALFGAMVAIYKIVRLDFNRDIAHSTLFFLSIFPLAFFYQAAYADSLFLFLSSLSFYFARRQRWGWAGIFCGLTTMTRLSGIALLPALTVEWYLQNSKKLVHLNKLVKVVGLGSLGLVGYMTYLWQYFGDPLRFQTAMSAWSQSGWVFPPQVIFRYLKIFWFVEPHELVFWIAVGEFVTLFLYLFLALYVLRRIRMSYGVFMVVLLSLVAFTGTFAGTPRYLLHLFPGFVAIALLTQGRKWLRIGLSAALLLLGAVLTGLFTRGYFVA